MRCSLSGSLGFDFFFAWVDDSLSGEMITALPVGVFSTATSQWRHSITLGRAGLLDGADPGTVSPSYFTPAYPPRAPRRRLDDSRASAGQSFSGSG